MGTRTVSSFAGRWVNLILRARSSFVLVDDDEDSRVLELVAQRMLFWCGGSIHGYRCEANEMAFAVQLGHVSIGAVARYLSGGYAIHLRRRRGAVGRVFRPYRATVLDDETFLDDFVLWLHRPAEAAVSGGTRAGGCWTGNAAYLSTQPSWITTEPVLRALGRGESARVVYRRRRLEPTDPAVVRQFKRSRGGRHKYVGTRDAVGSIKARPSIERIVQAVAAHSRVPYEEMRSASRKRTVTRAKTVAAVLCTRNGISAAAVARFFHRSRSTLVEQAEYYRDKQPHIFNEAERALADLLVEGAVPGSNEDLS